MQSPHTCQACPLALVPSCPRKPPLLGPLLSPQAQPGRVCCGDRGGRGGAGPAPGARRGAAAPQRLASDAGGGRQAVGPAQRAGAGGPKRQLSPWPLSMKPLPLYCIPPSEFGGAGPSPRPAPPWPLRSALPRIRLRARLLARDGRTADPTLRLPSHIAKAPSELASALVDAPHMVPMSPSTCLCAAPGRCGVPGRVEGGGTGGELCAVQRGSHGGALLLAGAGTRSPSIVCCWPLVAWASRPPPSGTDQRAPRLRQRNGEVAPPAPQEARSSRLALRSTPLRPLWVYQAWNWTTTACMRATAKRDFPTPSCRQSSLTASLTHAPPPHALSSPAGRPPV